MALVERMAPELGCSLAGGLRQAAPNQAGLQGTAAHCLEGPGEAGRSWGCLGLQKPYWAADWQPWVAVACPAAAVLGFVASSGIGQGSVAAGGSCEWGAGGVTCLAGGNDS